ncbi:MAG: hypothetical protein GF364_20320, partial [Candidatus Lokiarchaeota archaeon]|nr:hypothetical protein [Candidatus Lokiarchaeota archaeon]
MISLTYIADRQVTFYDYITQTDVSNQYESILPVKRYLFEPFIALTYLIGISLEDWLLLFIIVYPVIRLIILVGNRWSYKGNILNNSILIEMKKVLDFFFTITILAIAGIGIRLLIYYPSGGFIYIADHYSYAFEISFKIILSLTLIRSFYGLLVLKHPNRRINTNSIARLIKVHFKSSTATESKDLADSEDLTGYHHSTNSADSPSNDENISEFGSKTLVQNRKEPNNQRNSCLLKSISFISAELLRLIKVGLLLLIISLNLTGCHLPTQRIEANLSNDEFLFDFHVHTTKSDGWLDPCERVNWYLNQGINGAAFSDHHNTRGAQLAAEYVEENDLNFTVFLAQEYTASKIHLNIFGIEEAIIPPEYSCEQGTTQLNVSDMIEYVKSHGGYVTVNHYDNISDAAYTYEQLRDWGVDGFEIINEGDLYPNEIRQFCLDNNLACMGGSDIHQNFPLNTFVRLKLPDPTNLSLDAIFSELKKNTHQVISIQEFSLLKITKIYALDNFLSYIFEMNQFQTGSWVLWSYGVFM